MIYLMDIESVMLVDYEVLVEGIECDFGWFDGIVYVVVSFFGFMLLVMYKFD